MAKKKTNPEGPQELQEMKGPGTEDENVKKGPTPAQPTTAKVVKSDTQSNTGIKGKALVNPLVSLRTRPISDSQKERIARYL